MHTAFKATMISLAMLTAASSVAPATAQVNGAFFATAKDKTKLWDYAKDDFFRNNIDVANSKYTRNVELIQSHEKLDARKPTILFFHGNSGINTSSAKLVQLRAAGYQVIAVQCPGYGGSIGVPSEQGYREAAYAALEYTKSIGIPLSNILLFGESMGTGVATFLQSRLGVRGAILEAPYSVFAEAINHTAKIIPTIIAERFANKNDAQFNSIGYVNSMRPSVGTVSTIIYSCSGDRVVPLAGTNALAQAYLRDGHLLTHKTYDPHDPSIKLRENGRMHRFEQIPAEIMTAIKLLLSPSQDRAR
jgi:pimeloyl-ACP methyl ester carboxylesterase